MWTNIFENRDRKVTSLIKLADCLGRSLRENVELFSINDNVAIFLTESNKVIKGDIDIEDGVSLRNIEVEDADLFKDDSKFDNFVNEKVSAFIQNIFDDDYSKAKKSYRNVLDLWEDRIKFNRVSEKLDEHASKFGESFSILESKEFSKLEEITIHPGS